MIVRASKKSSGVTYGLLPGPRPLRLAVCAACCLLAVASAGAQLRYRGVTLHGGLWKRVYSQLPTAWKARQLVYVREISDRDMDRFVGQFEGPNDRTDSVIDGCYQKYPDPDEMAGRITLRESLHGENAALVFVHEYGHYVWSNVLTAVDRTLYQRLWREQKRAGNLVTEYAGETGEEGFAEAFAYYVRRPVTLRRLDPQSNRFLRNVERDSIQEFEEAELR